MILRTSGIIHFSGKTEFLVPVFGSSVTPWESKTEVSWSLSCCWNEALSFWWKPRSWRPADLRGGEKVLWCEGRRLGTCLFCLVWAVGPGCRFHPLWSSVFDVVNKCSQLANVGRQVRCPSSAVESEPCPARVSHLSLCRTEPRVPPVFWRPAES